MVRFNHLEKYDHCCRLMRSSYYWYVWGLSRATHLVLPITPSDVVGGFWIICIPQSLHAVVVQGYISLCYADLVSFDIGGVPSFLSLPASGEDVCSREAISNSMGPRASDSRVIPYYSMLLYY